MLRADVPECLNNYLNSSSYFFRFSSILIINTLFYFSSLLSNLNLLAFFARRASVNFAGSSSNLSMMLATYCLDRVLQGFLGNRY